MRCASCGGEIPDWAAVCGYCGTRVTKAAPPPLEAPPPPVEVPPPRPVPGPTGPPPGWPAQEPVPPAVGPVARAAPGRSRRVGGVRLAAGAVFLALGLAGVGIAAALLFAGEESALPATTTAVPTTTTWITTSTAPAASGEQYDADVELIEELWQGLTESWTNLRGAARYISQHNYPAYSWPASVCLASLREGGYEEEEPGLVVVDSATITRDDFWVIPEGSPGEGQAPEGRVYVMELSFLGAPVMAHVTIIGGVAPDAAYFFIPCAAGG